MQASRIRVGILLEKQHNRGKERIEENEMTMIETVYLTKMECGKCGSVYAISESYRALRQIEGNGWHCPYCQASWGYFLNNENAMLKKQLEEKQRELTASKCETLREKQLRELVVMEKAKADRKLRRNKKGVCTCCNRSFTNLRRHMETKHGK